MSGGQAMIELPLKGLGAGWLGSIALIVAAIANKDTMWIFLSLMAASIAINALLGGIVWMILKSSDYWMRQPRRVRSGLNVEPEPWYVRVVARSHESRILRKVLG